MLQLGRAWLDLDAGILEREEGSLVLTGREVLLLRQLVTRSEPALQSREARAALARLQRHIEPDLSRPRFLLSAPDGGWRLVLPTASTESIPSWDGAFFGRTAARAALGRLWRSGVRWCTIVGFGGLGKTRLAAEEARAEASSCRVLWADLTGTGTVDELRQAVASRLSVRSLDRLGAALGEQIDLLILDNLDDVAPQAAPALTDWLAAAPALRILGTSQRPIGAPGEHLLPLEPMSRSSGAAMLAARAGWRHRTAEAEAVAERLGGMPLAIELVAASGRSPQSLTDHTEEILRDSRLSGVPARHTTLRSTLTVSWSRLSAAEQRGGEALSILTGSFPEVVASVLIGADSEAILSSLLDRAMLQRDGNRLRMLTTIRDFARTREGREREAALSRLLDHLAVHVRQPDQGGAQPREWVTALGEGLLIEVTDLALARKDPIALGLSRMLALAQVNHRGSAQEHIERLQAALESVGGTPRQRLRAQSVLAWKLKAVTRSEAGGALFEAVSAGARAIGDVELEAINLVRWASTGAADARVARARQGLALSRIAPTRALARICEGFALRGAGRLEEARAVLEAARADCGTDTSLHGRVDLGLGGLCQTGAEIRAWLESFASQRQRGLVDLHLRAYFQLLEGYFLMRIGEDERARSLLHVARRAFQHTGDAHNEKHTLWNLTLVYLLRREVELADRYLRQAERLSAGTALIESEISCGRSILALLQGNVTRARRVLQQVSPEPPRFWSAVVAAFSGNRGDLRRLRGALSDAQNDALERVADGQPVTSEQLATLRRDLDVELDDRLLVALLEHR